MGGRAGADEDEDDDKGTDVRPDCCTNGFPVSASTLFNLSKSIDPCSITVRRRGSAFGSSDNSI